MEKTPENWIGERVIGAAIDVHRALGPGLLESAYEACLAHELDLRGLSFCRQAPVSIFYKGVEVAEGFRADLIIEQKVVVELKSIEKVQEVHKAQLLSYLRLGGFRLGYLINFNTKLLRDGVHRIVNALPTD